MRPIVKSSPFYFACGIASTTGKMWRFLSGCKPPTTSKPRNKEDVQETNKNTTTTKYYKHFREVEQKGRHGWHSMLSSFSFWINLRKHGIPVLKIGTFVKNSGNNELYKWDKGENVRISRI